MNIDFSNRIQCSSCQKLLLEIRFSENSKIKYRESVRLNARNSKVRIKLPLCLDCSPGSHHEMICVMCGTTQRLEGFSKAQRKKPDDAHCLDCQQEKEDREPHHRDEVAEIETMEKLKRMAILDSSVLSGTGGMKSTFLTQSDEEHFETDTNPEVGVWTERTLSIRRQKVSAFSDSRSSTNANIDSGKNQGWNNYADRHGGFQRVGNTSMITSYSGSPGFAKQGAVKKHPQLKALENIEREQRRGIEHLEQVDLVGDKENDDDDDYDDKDPY